MEQFGDELIIQSFKIPWLIWIHLLVTVLLVILLLFGFTVFTSDDSISPSSSTAASPSTYSSAAVPAHLTKPSSSHRKSKATSLGVRCSRHSFHLQKSRCLACACPGTRKRTYNWSVIRLKTTGSRHMRYLHHVPADSKPT